VRRIECASLEGCWVIEEGKMHNRTRPIASYNEDSEKICIMNTSY